MLNFNRFYFSDGSIIFADFTGFHGISKLLVKHGAFVDAIDSHQNTPLHVVSALGDSDEHFAIAELLLSNRANVNARNFGDETPLDVVSNGRMAQLLERYGGKHSRKLVNEKPHELTVVVKI